MFELSAVSRHNDHPRTGYANTMWNYVRCSHPAHGALRGILSILVVVATAMTSGISLAGPKQTFAGRTPSESSPPHWPSLPTAPEGAPNILLIMTDDVGFGGSSTFGGPVPTPTMDELARQGLRFNRFHTTALCSPTRASLLTGREPHNVNVGSVTNWPTVYVGYTSVIPPSAATVAEVLRLNGFATAMFGKGHVTPEWEMSQAGPFDRWPTGLGFQYFYGFLGADMNQFAPLLVENTTPVEPARGKMDYHLDADLADKAVDWILEQHAIAPDNPLFVYYAPGTAHAPNQAPKAWMEKFKGRFDEGWDRMQSETYARQKALGVIPEEAGLAPRPEKLPAWDSLPTDRKKLYARFMEAYAASLAYADEQIGRVVDAFKSTGRYDNTLIIYIQGDNGASAEGRMHGRVFEQSGINGFDEELDYMMSRIEDIGGPTTYPLNTGGWAWAMNAPFPRSKRIASHLGGTRNGLVMSWPKRIGKAGEVRSQFHHVSDIMPTILEAAGIAVPAEVNGVPQQPIDGISMLYAFDDAGAESRRTAQVFEMFENLGLYYQGWMVSTRPVSTFWDPKRSESVPLDDRIWELYDLRTDFSQVNDLAEVNPPQLAKMKDLFWIEAARNNILPIHGPLDGREGFPSLTAGRTTFTYYPGADFIAENAAPPIIGHAFTITADVTIPEQGAAGVLVTQGGRFGGYALYVRENRLVFHYNALDPMQFTVRSVDPLSPGRHELGAQFSPDSEQPGTGGTITLNVDHRVAGQGRIDRTLRTWISHIEGFDVGQDHGTAVNDEYTIDNSQFTGELSKLVVTTGTGR